VPAGITVIALAWVLMNLKMKVGPIMFLAGLVPVGLVAVMAALGRDEPAYAEDYPPEDGSPPEEEPPYEDDAPPSYSIDEDNRG
jgi:hypothetical protein